MSVRYGISLIPEPRFTARVYRARQLICGQYASWAAEMHMVHLPLLSYFQCPETQVESPGLRPGNGGRGMAGPRRHPLAHGGVDAEYNTAGSAGDIFLDFATAESASQSGEDAIHPLMEAVVEKLIESGLDPILTALAWGNYLYRIALMQHANLPPAVFASAVAFAQAVVNDLEVPTATTAWQLALIRFESDAAGEDWSGGRWAADLRWQLVNNHPFN